MITAGNSFISKPKNYFYAHSIYSGQAITYTANGTTQAITSLNFQPDLSLDSKTAPPPKTTSSSATAPPAP